MAVPLTKTRSVLLVFPPADAGNDGLAVAAWAVEALRDEHRLSVLAARAPDVASINQQFATTLRPDDYELLQATPRFGRVGSLVTRARVAAERAAVRRALKDLGPAFDVVLSLDGAIDAGGRAIQYIHDPRPGSRLDRAFDRVFAMPPVIDAARNLTLVSSYWTGVIFRQRYAAETITLYPPAICAPPLLPWSERDDAFICVAPRGNRDALREAVEIVALARERGNGTSLKIAAPASDRSAVSAARSLSRRHRGWAETAITPDAGGLRRLFARTRYAIVAAHGEPFGVDLASMVASGMVALAPHDAGAIEILDDDERLLYSSPDDAAAKIARILASERLSEHLHSKLAAQARALSPESFTAQLRRVVRDFAPAA